MLTQKNIHKLAIIPALLSFFVVFAMSTLLFNFGTSNVAKALDCAPGQTAIYVGSTLSCVDSTTTTSSGLVCTGGGLTIPKCVGKGPYKCTAPGTECLKNIPIVLWISFFINMLASIIGVGAIIMVIIAGLQYSASRDNPQAIQAAKQKMTNVLLGLAGFIFLYSFLQWLIPGGVF